MGVLVKESVVTIGPKVPESIKNRLYLVSTCAFTVHEISIFSRAFQVFADYISGNPEVNPESHVSALFVDRDDFCISLDDPAEFGLCLSIVIYPLHRWRAASMGNQCMYACIFEELCHHFFVIRDEITVKHKVSEIMRIIFPDFEFGSFYNP